MEKCKNCKEYSTCPLLGATLQRNYANRNLDNISQTLAKIEDLLKKFAENNGIKD